MKNSLIYIQKLFLFVFLFTTTHAEHNTTIDRGYKTVANAVLDLSEYVDTGISQWLNDSNETTNSAYCESESTNLSPNQDIDAFFQNEKYLNESQDTYIRLRVRNYLYSRQDNKIKLKLNAQIPFNKCKKEWQFFLQDVQARENEIKNTDTSYGGVGIRYDKTGFYGIKSNYSLGLRNTSVYVRARYRYLIEFEDWTIEPVQSFRYSDAYDLELESNLYFDKRINEESLFRIQLNRESSGKIEGIDYGLSFEYFLELEKKTGLRIRQSFYGNTHYNDFYAFDPDYSGINNYVTSINWRQNIWRKWFFYEIRPTINFHKDYDYSPSYSLRFIMDFYFGEFQ